MKMSYNATELFALAYHVDRRHELIVINRYTISDLDVKCLCGKKVEVREYEGICEGCGRNFIGPLKRSY